LRERFVFNPYVIQERRQWYRFVSSGLIHADWIHLIINMFVLYSFGQIVETDYKEVFDEKSTYYYLLLYFGGMILSVVPTFAKQKNNPGYNALGASGGVASVVFAFILFHPMEKLCLYGVLCFPGIIFGVIYLGYCYFAGKRKSSFINHDAHFWGAVFGVLFTIALKPQIIQIFINQLPFLQDAF
jgi:membrane associated rhomboid family serine protease